MKKILFGIALFGAFFLTTAIPFSKPAQAKINVAGHYKYLLALESTDNGTRQDMGHGAQFDFLWGLGPVEGGKKIPSFSLGFDTAVGYFSDEDSDGIFYKIAFLSEINLDSGLGFTLGVGGAHLVNKQGHDIWGMGFTDLGMRYSLKNGLFFSTSVDLMFDPTTFGRIVEEENGNNTTSTTNDSNDITFILGVSAGVGYRF